MSLDRSLKGANALVRHRNVLTRAERLEKLAESGKWDEKKAAMGLPKVANRKVEAVKTVKEAAEGEAAVAGAPAAAPAAGAKGAAPAATGGAPAAKGAAPAAGAKAAAPAAKKK